MENLIISKSICPSVSYNIGNHQLQPWGLRVPSGVCRAVGSHQLPHTPRAPLGTHPEGLEDLPQDSKCRLLPGCAQGSRARIVLLAGSLCQGNAPAPASVPPGFMSWRGLIVPSDTPCAQGYLMQTDPSPGSAFLALASASTVGCAGLGVLQAGQVCDWISFLCSGFVPCEEAFSAWFLCWSNAI